MIAYKYKYKKSVNPMEILENKAVEPSLKDSTDYLVALMVLKQIEADNELDPLLRSMKSRLDKAGVGANPYHLLNTVFSQEAIVESKAAYAEIWDAIYKEIEQANIKATLPHVGYSQTEIDSIPDDVIQHFNTVAVFEEKFPDDGSKNFPLAERLKVGKDMLFDALTSDKGKAALNAASWGISLATGGIVTRLAIKGGAALASRLIANESVQSFAGKVQSSVTNFLQRTGVPTGALAGHLRDFKENAKAVIASPVFQRYGKPSLALAGLALGAILLGNVNHDKIVELASNGLSKGAELASAGADAALSGVSSAPGFVGDVATAAAGTVYTGVVEGGNLLVDGVSAAYNDPIGTLNKIASGTADSVKAAGGYVANAASDALDAVSQAPGAIADVAKSGFETVSTEAGNAAEKAREFVAGGLHEAGNLVAGNNPDPDSVIDSKKVLADSPEENVASPDTKVSAAPTSYEIQKGDSLWKISKDQLIATGIEPTNQQIHEATQKLYEANKDLIGANPDKIFTGKELRIDPELFIAKADPSADLKAMSEMLGTKPGFPVEPIAQAGPEIGKTAQAASPASLKSELAHLDELLNGTPADGAVSFKEAARRVSSRDLTGDSSLGM